jgi:AcrR family transcriptional regulator
MGTRERREREKQETRERILDAAREMFATQGVEATTMRAIADRIEYTPTAIYYHFRDKDELIRELCHTDFASLAGAFNRIGRIEDPVERLRRIGMAYVEFAIEHPHHYRIMFMTDTAHAEPECGSERGNPEEGAYAFLRATVAEGIEAGRYRPDFADPDELAQLAWAAVHGVVSLRIAKGNDPWIEWTDTREAAVKMTDTLIRGIVREGV